MLKNAQLVFVTIPGCESQLFSAKITPHAHGCTVTIVQIIGDGEDITAVLDTEGIDYTACNWVEDGPGDFSATFELKGMYVEAAIAYIEELFLETVAPDFAIYSYGDNGEVLLEITPIGPEAEDYMFFMCNPQELEPKLDATMWAAFGTALRDEGGANNQRLRETKLELVECGASFLNLTVRGCGDLLELMLQIAQHYP